MSGDNRSYLPYKSEYRNRWQSMTLDEWILYHQKNIVFDKCTWMGVRTLKNPLDIWIYQEIIHTVKPDVILEIGTANGGSALYFAHLLDLLDKGKVVSIDKEMNNCLVKHSRITLIEGFSQDPQVIEKVYEICREKTVLIVHDGSHLKEDILKDLNNFKDLVSIGSYFIVEDGVMDIYESEHFKAYKDGPLAATEEFVASNPNFVVDTDCERYIVTYNPRGYLKRISRSKQN